ncbi:hypothetical protein DICA3_C09824 [Diutina catenulata]
MPSTDYTPEGDYPEDPLPNPDSVDSELFLNHRYTKLDVLTKDLSQELDQLNTQLRDLVNVSFDDFVRLGKSINLEEDPSCPDLQGVRTDLGQYLDSVEQKHRSLSASQSTAERVVAHRRRLIALKTEAKLGLILNDLVATFEQSLAASADDVHLVGLFLAIKTTFAKLPEKSPVAQALRAKITSVSREVDSFVATKGPWERSEIQAVIKETLSQ